MFKGDDYANILTFFSFVLTTPILPPPLPPDPPFPSTPDPRQQTTVYSNILYF
jgi:hypothetical protein